MATRNARMCSPFQFFPEFSSPDPVVPVRDVEVLGAKTPIRWQPEYYCDPAIDPHIFGRSTVVVETEGDVMAVEFGVCFDSTGGEYFGNTIHIGLLFSEDSGLHKDGPLCVDIINIGFFSI